VGEMGFKEKGRYETENEGTYPLMLFEMRFLAVFVAVCYAVAFCALLW
jgi:nitrogen fixation/metabolism regulation signal transduction histidine kinase